MNSIIITVPLKPLAHKETKKKSYGGKSWLYADKDIERYKEKIKESLLEYMPREPWDCAIKAEVTFYILRPKSISKKIKYCSNKPDRDNLEKPLWDAMQGIMFTNDSRIADGRTIKIYCDKESDQRIEVYLEKI